MQQAGTLQHARKGGNQAGARAWNRGTVLAVPDIASAKFSGAAAEYRQSRAADERRKFPAEDLVAEAEFAAAAGVVAKIEAAAGALVAKDGHASLAGKCVARQLGSESVGRNENVGIAQRLEKFGRSQITGAKNQVVPP